MKIDSHPSTFYSEKPYAKSIPCSMGPPRSLLGILACILAYAALTMSARGQNKSNGGGRGGAADDLATDFYDGHEVVSREILVGFRPDVPMAERARLRRNAGAEEKRSFGRFNCHCWRLPNQAAMAGALTALQRSPGVRYAEPNYVVHANGGIPNDPMFHELWGMRNIGQTGGTPGADSAVARAWNVTTGGNAPDGKKIIVGVIDSGVDYTHYDLMNNMWVNEQERDGDDNVDDDGNGYVDDIYGYDFANGDGDPMDDNNHGTHVAGTIGATANDGIGVVGVCWDVEIMALKFLGANGSGATDAAIGCLEYALANGARLTNNSWGGGGFSQALADAIEASRPDNQKMLFVAAAGNANNNNDDNPHYPSSYELDNIIAVAATDHDDEKASFSSYGFYSVDIAAPGVEVLSSIPGNQYDHFNGTSMATPHVAGAVALAWDLVPDASYTTIRQAVIDSGDVIPSMVGITQMGARLNVSRLLSEVAFVVVSSTPELCAATETDHVDFEIVFSEPVDFANVGDTVLTVGGVSSASVKPDTTDPNTVVFTFASSPILLERDYYMELNPAGIVSLTGNPLQAWSGSFLYDMEILEVVEVLSPDPVGPLPLTTMTLQLSEGVDPLTVAREDFRVSQGSVVSAEAVAPDYNTIILQLAGIEEEGEWKISLNPETLADPNGHPNLGWNLTATLDYGVFPVVADAFEVVPPAGSLIYEKTIVGTIDSGDQDQFVVELDPWQTLAVVVEPDSTFIPSVTVTGEASPVNVTATQSGQTVQTPLVSTDGASKTFTIDVSSAGSVGGYSTRILLNAVADDELELSPDPEAVQHLTGFTSLSASADRAAVVGSLNHVYSIPSIVETFDAQALSNYTEQKGNSDSNTSVVEEAAHEEDDTNDIYGLLDAETYGSKGWIYRDDPQAQVSPGDTISVWVRAASAGGRAYFGFGAGSKGTLSMVMAPDTGEVLLGENGGYRYTDIGASPFNWESDKWYLFDIDWKDGGDIVGRVFGSDGETLLATVTGNSLAFTSGGIAFRGFGPDKHFDTVTKRQFDAEDLDVYGFTLADGDAVTLVLNSLNGGPVGVELLDPSMTPLVEGVGGHLGIGAITAEYVAPASAGTGTTYYARVTGEDRVRYSLTVLKNAGFDVEPNDGFASAVELTGSSTILGTVLNRVAPGEGMIEDFEDESDFLNNYISIDEPATTLSAAAALEGGLGLLDETGQTTNGWIYRDDFKTQVMPGEKISVWVRSEGDASGRAYLGFGASAAGSYTLSMAPNAGALALYLNEDYGFEELATTPQTWLGDKWYRLEADWRSNGDIIGHVYDSDGVTLLNTVKTNDSTYTSGGISFRAFGSPKHLDSVQRAVPNADYYRIDLSAGETIMLATGLPAGETGVFGNDLDPMLEIYDDISQLPVASDDNSGGSQNAMLGYTAINGGTHYIVVSSSGASGPTSGEYILDYGLVPPSNYAPSFASDPIVEVNATEGESYGATLADDASDPEGDPITFSKIDGPAWLTVAANGVLGGRPRVQGLSEFTVQVEDATGSDTATLQINVLSSSGVHDMFVADILMTPASHNGNRYSAIARVTVMDQLGQPVTGATVFGTWSGATSQSVSAVTDESGVGVGVAVFNSKRVKNGGMFTFTVTDISAAESNYNAGLNAESSASVSAP